MNKPTPIDPTQVQVGGPTVSAATARGFPTIAGYEILSELGRGGMGVVYEAKHLNLDRIIALKLMRGDDPLNKARFLAEGQVIAAVKHPHVVEIYDFGESSIGPYIAMEYLTGGTFGDLLKTGLVPRVAAELIAKIATGVGAAHNLGIVHRDLKPGNVLLDHLGSPKVTDFGLAKRSTSDLTMTHDAAGTPAYMAPEQARAMKFVGPPADVWSLGVMLYESLTGKRPFTGDSNVQLLAAIQNDDPPTLRTISRAIPQDLETICLKCLEKEPERRYASANELAEDLRRFKRGEPVKARPIGALERLTRAFTHSRMGDDFAPWSNACYLMAALDIIYFLAAHFQRQAQYEQILLTHFLGVGAFFLLFAYGHVCSRKSNVLERQFFAVLYFGLATHPLCALLQHVMAGHAMYEDVRLYPFLFAVNGLCFCILGSAHAGLFYIPGLISWALALVLTQFLEHVHWVTAAFWVPTMALLGWHFRRLGKPDAEPSPMRSR